MSHRSTVIYEAEEVEAGRLSIEDCEYPEEVLNELSGSDFDSRGYIIPHNMNWDNNYDYKPQENNEQNNHDKTCLGICCLLFLIFWFFSVLTYHPNI
ncbi:MAG: hypothetical protein IJI98_08430 [Methanosphaera sp.]|uniref:hypothetical protein n=1 Tax=Methanosphaera sp. ISO3-F5 TaxID=1452353 RepID=UPI002B2574E7|nr:hypothetical protein [Methanosphaera sp. ISO3-F5]MBR0472702.1 hypothetical protein [Methanosphaera sp.]WQH63613.1 hypothetical protein PXD04_07875 [Methanosphaera sp. ISO3-F5]